MDWYSKYRHVWKYNSNYSLKYYLFKNILK
jgi:hypothetical protein